MSGGDGAIGLECGVHLRSFGDLRTGQGVQPRTGYGTSGLDFRLAWQSGGVDWTVGHDRSRVDDAWRTHRRTEGRSVLIFVESSITAVNEPYSPDPPGILVHWTVCPGPFRDKFNLSLGTECGLMAGVICKGLILWALVFLSAPQRTTGLLELIPCHLERTRSV